jgi:hypothetical protein
MDNPPWRKPKLFFLLFNLRYNQLKIKTHAELTESIIEGFFFFNESVKTYDVNSGFSPSTNAKLLYNLNYKANCLDCLKH